MGTCLQCAAGGFFCNQVVSSEQQAVYDQIDAAIVTGELHSPFAVPAATHAGHSAPSLGQQAWNLMSSLAAFVADGLQTVPRDEYEARLQICDACEFRLDDRCLQCGCYLSLKAQGRAFTCPLNKWPVSDQVSTAAT